jgi:hypothetical protein
MTHNNHARSQSCSVCETSFSVLEGMSLESPKRLDVYATKPLHLNEERVESELHHASLENVSNFHLSAMLLLTLGEKP